MKTQMDADERRKQLNEVTEAIIGCCYKVANTLGTGFLEKVYENALVHELTKAGRLVQQQVPIAVRYDDIVVGEYVADLLVVNAILVELKAISFLEKVHSAQCMNYLRATELSICLLVNFGRPRIQIERIVNNF